MDRFTFFINILWTNFPLLVAGYYLIKGIIRIESNQYPHRDIMTGAVGIFAYIVYMSALLLYIKDDVFLIFLADLLKIIGPIYVVYLMIGVNRQDKNAINEALIIIFLLLSLGLWRLYIL